MSDGRACGDEGHRSYWVVVQRNYSEFVLNGYRRQASDYSRVQCTLGSCNADWRTKAAYVEDLPDMCRGCGGPARTKCRICRQSRCGMCSSYHHHEGYGTPAADTR